MSPLAILMDRHTYLMVEAIKVGLDPQYASDAEANELAEYIDRWSRN